jgi:hypothetical protein
MINAQGVFEFMDRASHYRRQGDHARELAKATLQPNLEEMLRHLAQDFDEIADDIDSGATEARNPELLPIGAARLVLGEIRSQVRIRSANYWAW